MLTALFLGTGTSVGVPMIGCRCAVCTSSNPRNRRRRTSAYITCGTTRILVDTPPDFREQALTFGLDRVDAVFFTHAHADHIFGFDDLRRFNTIQNAVIPAYGGPDTIRALQRIFNYVRTDAVPGHYRPRIAFEVLDGSLTIGEVRVTPVAVDHGETETFGFRFDGGGASFAYIPDCHSATDDVVAMLQGLDAVALDALRDKPHRTHLTIAESLELLHRINARKSFLIHLCHEIDHDDLSALLPDGYRVAYDGLQWRSGTDDDSRHGDNVTVP